MAVGLTVLTFDMWPGRSCCQHVSHFGHVHLIVVADDTLCELWSTYIACIVVSTSRP